MISSQIHIFFNTGIITNEILYIVFLLAENWMNICQVAAEYCIFTNIFTLIYDSS